MTPERLEPDPSRSSLQTPQEVDHWDDARFSLAARSPADCRELLARLAADAVGEGMP
jgi:hypothetical protein